MIFDVCVFVQILEILDDVHKSVLGADFSMFKEIAKNQVCSTMHFLCLFFQE